MGSLANNLPDIMHLKEFSRANLRARGCAEHQNNDVFERSANFDIGYTQNRGCRRRHMYSIYSIKLENVHWTSRNTEPFPTMIPSIFYLGDLCFRVMSQFGKVS